MLAWRNESDFQWVSRIISRFLRGVYWFTANAFDGRSRFYNRCLQWQVVGFFKRRRQNNRKLDNHNAGYDLFFNQWEARPNPLRTKLHHILFAHHHHYLGSVLRHSLQTRFNRKNGFSCMLLIYAKGKKWWRFVVIDVNKAVFKSRNYFRECFGSHHWA